jgi:tetratricopeptide (TPR) repeat protein
MQPIHFEIVDEILETKHSPVENKSRKQSSLARLITNSEHITKLFAKRNELMHLRFDELDLLRDIREIIEADPVRFENIKDPSRYKREVRAKILPKYITKDFIRMTQDRLLSEIFHSSLPKKDQDALMTAMVFLQSHTDLGVPCEENPLWEIIFNLSIKDGIRFVDSLAALIEGLDTLKLSDPDAITQAPLVLQMTKEVCQWPIFWRQLVKHKNVDTFEALVSSLLRGEMMVELYFDEIVHLPLLLYQRFNNRLSQNASFFEDLSDTKKEKIAKTVFKSIVESAILDLPILLPILKDRIKKAKKKAVKNKNNGKAEQFKVLFDSLENEDTSQNTFLLTLLIAKISIKRYWENKRDFFFYFTIFKNPEKAQSYYEFGQILYKLKHFDSIEKVLKCAIEVDDTSFWGYWGLGNYQLRQNKLIECEKNLQTALKIAQQLEIHARGQLKRELFLIKEDLKKLKSKKLKQRTNDQPQINLF